MRSYVAGILKVLNRRSISLETCKFTKLIYLRLFCSLV